MKQNCSEFVQMAYTERSVRQCRNCGCYHRTRTGMYSSDCILLSYRSHKNNKQKHQQSFTESDLIVYPMPQGIREQARLFDNLWFNFVDVKHEVDDQRELLASRCRQKGSLKVKAPLLWLHWRRWDGAQGQTRNQENWEQLWKTFVSRTCEDEAGNHWRQPVAWLTIVRHVGQAGGAPLSPTLSAASSYSSNSTSSLSSTNSAYLNATMLGKEVTGMPNGELWRNLC